MFYQSSNALRTKQDYEMLLQELKSYQQLSQDRDLYNYYFEINVDLDKLILENTYYESDIQEIKDILEHWNYNNLSQKHNKYKTKLNRYTKKQITKNKLLKLHKYGLWWTTYKQIDENGKSYIIRCYIGNNKNSRTTYHKKQANKKVRKYKGKLKRKNYKKVYDYWCEIF